MKLRELIETIEHYETVDFEIMEQTYPEELYLEGILKKYPYAADYRVVRITPVMKTNFGQHTTAAEASLFIEVSDGRLTAW